PRAATSSIFSFFFSITLRPPSSTLFPYTTLFRSWRRGHRQAGGELRRHHHRPAADRADRAAKHRGSVQVDPRRVGRELRRRGWRSEEHTSELQSRENLVCRLLLEKKNTKHPLPHD